MRPTLAQPLRRPEVLRTIGVRTFCSTTCLRRAFREGDVVLLREKDRSEDGRLITLKASGNTQTHKGVILHKDIIGRKPRQIVLSNRGVEHRLVNPTLAEYVRLTPRLVTPLYPWDCNLIVSLLDIHVDTPSHGPSNEPPLEILEAGTGHGALTLHLSRAIHAANPHIPRSPSINTVQEEEVPEDEDAVYLGETVSDLQERAVEAWKKDRRAIVHTLDISREHSNHARKIVNGFREGMYAGNIDFHVGDISAWIADQKKKRKTEEPFLTHVFLDLPDTDKHLANVAPVLHIDGILAVFNPSITQIAECVEAIHENKMPYVLDRVLELGAATIREWTVQAVFTKARLREFAESKKAKKASKRKASQGEETSEGESTSEHRIQELAESMDAQDKKWSMVCRPRAGQMVVGGGFLALWRRMENPASFDEKAVRIQQHIDRLSRQANRPLRILGHLTRSAQEEGQAQQ